MLHREASSAAAWLQHVAVHLVDADAEAGNVLAERERFVSWGQQSVAASRRSAEAEVRVRTVLGGGSLTHEAG